MVLTKRLSKVFLDLGKAGAFYLRVYNKKGKGFNLYFDVAKISTDQCIIVWQIITTSESGGAVLVDRQEFTTEWEMMGEQVMLSPSYYDVATLIARNHD